jgi:NAD-dependent dihydropyrimidine dehydrogenase PreA subunit/flavodoxin
MNRGYLPIFFFSGTGNTWWAAARLAEALSAKGFDAEPLSIERLTPSQVSEAAGRAALIGLGYPIYGSDAPLTMQDFIHDLPPASGPKPAGPKPALAFATQAVWSGDGAYFMHDIIQSKGYDLRWAVTFNMPCNLCLDMGLVFNLFFSSLKAQPEDILKRVAQLAERVAQDKPWIMGRSALLSMGWVQRVPFRMSLSYWQSGILSVDPERCTACGRCESLCPVGNITLQAGLPVFGDQCNLCLRCFNYCPELAVTAFGKPFNPKWFGDEPYQGPSPDFQPEQLRGGS